MRDLEHKSVAARSRKWCALQFTTYEAVWLNVTGALALKGKFQQSLSNFRLPGMYDHREVNRIRCLTVSLTYMLWALSAEVGSGGLCAYLQHLWQLERMHVVLLVWAFIFRRIERRRESLYRVRLIKVKWYTGCSKGALWSCLLVWFSQKCDLY